MELVVSKTIESLVTGSIGDGITLLTLPIPLLEHIGLALLARVVVEDLKIVLAKKVFRGSRICDIGSSTNLQDPRCILCCRDDNLLVLLVRFVVFSVMQHPIEIWGPMRFKHAIGIIRWKEVNL